MIRSTSTSLRAPLLSAALVAAALASPSRARADGWGDYPLPVIDRPLSLPKGMAQGTLGGVLTLDDGAALQPSYPAISLSYGVTDDLMLSASGSLCLNGNGLCALAAQDAPLLGTWSFGLLGTYTFDKSGPSAMAFTLGFEGNALSPATEYAVPMGLLFRYTVVPEQFAILVTPHFDIALTDRNSVQFDSFTAPFALQLQAAPHLMLQATLTFFLPVDQPEPLTANLKLVGSVGAGVTWSITNRVDIGGAFTFLNLLGEGPTQGADARTLNLFVAWRL